MDNRSANISCMFPDFTAYYQPYHKAVSLTLSVLGIIGHSCTVRILTLKAVFNQTNVLMVALSVTQLVYLTGLICTELFDYADSTACYRVFWHWSALWLKLVVHHLQLVSCIGAIWLMVCLSAVRCFTFSGSRERGVRTMDWFTYRRAYLMCLGCLLLSLCICLPTTIWVTVYPAHSNARLTRCSHKHPSLNWSAAAGYAIGPSDWMYEYSGLQRVAHLWYTVLGKLVPCATVFVLSIVLACQLNHLKKQARSMEQNKLSSSTRKLPPPTVSRDSSLRRQSIMHHFTDRTTSRINIKNMNPYSRTTALIIVVMIVYEVGEIPNNLTLIYYEISRNGQQLQRCYRGVYELLAMLGIVYMSVNFAIYCTLSSNFRRHFCQLFCCCQHKQQRTAHHQNTESTRLNTMTTLQQQQPPTTTTRVYQNIQTLPAGHAGNATTAHTETKLLPVELSENDVLL